MKTSTSTGFYLLIFTFLFSMLNSFGQEKSSDLLVGTWTKEFNERSITFTMNSDHKYQVEFAGDDEVDVWGSYAVSGTQVTFTDKGGEYSSGEKGTYEFKVDGKSLTFSNVDDPVYGRSMLVEGNWTKAGNP